MRGVLNSPLPLSRCFRRAAELSKAENSGVGLTSGCITAVLSCPLDVVNTRLKSLPLGAKARPAHPPPSTDFVPGLPHV